MADDPTSPVEFCWAVIEQRWDGQQVLGIVRRDTLEHWIARHQVFECSTWGELRTSLAPELFTEICDLCGFDSALDADPGNPDDAPPSDDTPFDGTSDITAFEEGDWPPALAALVYDDVPMEVLNAHGAFGATGLNGIYATIAAASRDAVLRVLAARGHRLTEDPRIDDLANPWFCW